MRTARPGPGKRLAAENIFRHAKVAANASYFIFEKIAQRLDELQFHQFGQAAHIVVALDGLARAFHAARFDDIGIERSLHQPVHTAGFLRDAGCFVVKYGDELRANDLSFRFGIGNAGQFREEPLACIDGDEVESQFVAQILLHVDEFVLAQNAVVHEDARELVADGFMHENGCH